MEEEKKKKRIGIISDETLDLPEEMIKDLDISVVHYKMDFQELSNLEGDIYQRLRKAEEMGINSLIKTSQPSISDFLKAYKEKMEEFEEIICFTVSSKVSGAYNSALQAVKFIQSEAQKKITVFDSEGGTGELGLLIIRAAKMINEAKLGLSEINERLKKEVKNIKLIAFYDKAKWLEASGRVPKFIPMSGMEKITGIKPLLGLKGEKLTIIGIKRNVKNIADSLADEFSKRTEIIRQRGQKILVAITHADSIENAERLKNTIELLNNVRVVYINKLCPTIGGHTGPGAIALSWDENEN
ncbi:DegV family protein [bacterium]|nr:DegV family protein [bacterium]